MLFSQTHDLFTRSYNGTDEATENTYNHLFTFLKIRFLQTFTFIKAKFYYKFSIIHLASDMNFFLNILTIYSENVMLALMQEEILSTRICNSDFKLFQILTCIVWYDFIVMHFP